MGDQLLHQAIEGITVVGQERKAAHAERRVVEHRVGGPRRGPGGIQVSGRDRSHPVRVGAGGGEDLAHEAVPGGGALVGDVEDAGHPSDRQLPDGDGQVVREAGTTALVVDEGQLRPIEEAQDRLQHVRPVGPAHPGGAHHAGAWGVHRDGVLAGPLRAAVDRLGVGPIPLVVRLGLGAVEDVVGGHRHQVGAGASRGVGHPLGAERVHVERPLGIGLARVHRRPRAGVEHHVGSHRRGWPGTRSRGRRGRGRPGHTPSPRHRRPCT